MPARKKDLSPEEMLAQLASGIKKQAKLPNIYGYQPHDKQRTFHSSRAKKRLYIGGNRSGKTTSGVAEDIFYLRGAHPYKHLDWEPPIHGRVIGVDFLRGVESILIPQFKRWMPPSLLKQGSWDRSYSRETRTLTLDNGSTLEFMSYEQDTDKFAGVPRHFTHYDEEPPPHIYDECQARLIDYNGDAWFTMTPVEGMTWVYDKLYLPGIDGKGGVMVITADMTDNPYLNQEGVENFLSELDEDTRKQRQQGNFVTIGGLVYKQFSTRHHVIAGGYIPPKDWFWYASVDHGYNNPTAWLWHAVSPDNQVVTFYEHYEREMIVKDHAAKVHEINKMFGKIPDLIVGDPAIAQRQGVTGTSIQTEYADHGVYIMPGNNDVLIGVNQVQNYLRDMPGRTEPYWKVTENCVNLIREMGRLRWRTFAGRKAQFENNPHEQIHKKDDHACDSLRYFMCCLPDLAPPVAENSEKVVLDTGVNRRYDESLAISTGRAVTSDSGWEIWEGTDTYSLEYD